MIERHDTETTFGSGRRVRTGTLNPARRSALAVVAVGAMLLAACGSETSSDAASTDAPTTSAETTPAAEEASFQDPGSVAADEPEAGMDLESFLTDAIDNASNPTGHGTTMALIIEADGSVTSASNTADMDEIVVGPDDVFRIGSITKVFTAALTLGLVDDGLVDLDAPAGDYVSRVAVPDGVTVRHLLGHRSGIANYTTDQFFDETKADDSRVWTPEEMVAVVADVPAEFEPDSDYAYSNTNYILLGMLIEEITGMSYDEALRSQVLDPLGMASTYVDGFEDGPDVVGAYSSFFSESLEPITAEYTSVATGAWSAGAIVSSPADLHAFFTALAAGDVIHDELVAEMTTAQDEYGLGLMIGVGGLSDDVYGHGGSIPGFKNFVLHSPVTGRTGYSVSTSDAIDSLSTVEAMAPVLGLETIDSDALEVAAEEPPAPADELRPWEEGLVEVFPAGATRLPILGGVQFELDQDRPVIQLDSVSAGIRHDEVDPPAEAAETSLSVFTRTSSGEPIATSDELVAAIVDHVGAELTPIGDVVTAIGPAQGYDFTYDQTWSTVDEVNALPHLAMNDNWIWIPAPLGQMWIVDTERGPLMLQASPDSQGDGLDEAITTLDRVLETIEVVDFDG